MADTNGMLDSAAGLRRLTLDAAHRAAGARFAPFAGRKLGDIADELGCRAVDVLCDASIEDRLDAVFETQQFQASLDALKELVDEATKG